MDGFQEQWAAWYQGRVGGEGESESNQVAANVVGDSLIAVTFSNSDSV